MTSQRSSDYLLLSQFLDLESRWLGASDKAELAHRICRTADILLGTTAIAIGLQPSDAPYRIVAKEGDWPAPSDAGGEPLDAHELRASAAVALSSSTAQLQSQAETTIGVFPFDAGADTRGCLHVCVKRPFFDGKEVGFLRFLASLTGIVMAGGVSDASLAARKTATDGERDRNGAEAGARRYVAMTVHDLRNPLNVIAGYAGLLEDGELGTLTDQQHEAVDAINRQVGVLLGVIEQLIDLDRLDTPGANCAIDTFELRGLFEEIERTCFAGSSDRVRWPGAETAFEFTTDRRRLFSVVQNLVDNALKHTGPREITVDCTRRNAELVLSVADHGAGLDDRNKAALLGANRPADLQGSRAGIGLYAVGFHTRALGGKIEVRERQGGGTIIEVRVPAAVPRLRAVAAR